MRKLGILLPLASLPSDEGIGTTGKHAYKFIDYLASADVKFWQVL
ncbi:MAG: 4-alpha-glucanotransferase, partial [Clostridia bacterium]|nr:4-alpha-glucanotransferase [Clostridia bacterium]